MAAKSSTERESRSSFETTNTSASPRSSISTRFGEGRSVEVFPGAALIGLLGDQVPSSVLDGGSNSGGLGVEAEPGFGLIVGADSVIGDRSHILSVHKWSVMCTDGRAHGQTNGHLYGRPGHRRAYIATACARPARLAPKSPRRGRCVSS